MQMLYLEDMSEIAKKIRVLLADTGKSRKELAIGIERSPQTISGYISTSPVHQHDPDIDTLRKIAQFFGVSVTYFFDDGDKVQTTTETISEEDRKLLDQLKNLDAAGRRALRAFLSALKDQ